MRPADRGTLWENLVLDELLAEFASSRLRYWRDGTGREVDFVIPCGRDRVAAVEAKISPDAFSAGGLRAFRAAYADGPDLLCCPFVEEPYPRKFGGRVVTVCSPRHIPNFVQPDRPG